MDMKPGTASTVASALFGILYLLSLWIPLVGAISTVTTNEGGIGEKRELSSFPEFEWEDVKNWPEKFEDYFDDNFGFRDEFVTTNSALRYRLLRVSGKRVLFGKENWLFYNSSAALDQYRGVNRFASSDLIRFMGTIRSRSEWFRSQGVEFLYVAVPNKTTIYPEYLPEWIQKIGPSHLDQIQAYLEENGEPFPYLDLRDELLKAKDFSPLFFKTDTHWNTVGAYFAYRAIIDRLKGRFPRLRSLGDSDIEVEPWPLDRGLDLAQMLGVPYLFVEPYNYKLKLKFPSRVVEMRSWVNGREQEVAPGLAAAARVETLVTSDAERMPTVLFIRDSFSNSLFPFMNETFSQSHYVSDKGLLFRDDVFHRMKPDVVVVIWAERALNRVGQGKIDFLNPGFVDDPRE